MDTHAKSEKLMDIYPKLIAISLLVLGMLSLVVPRTPLFLIKEPALYSHWIIPSPITFEVVSIEPETGISEIIVEEIEVPKFDTPLEGRALYESYIFEICENYESVDPHLVISIVEHESNFEIDAQNGNHIGLTQCSTRWQTDRAKTLGVEDLWDPYGNLLTGIDLVNDLLENYADGDVAYALMLYNMNWDSARSLHKQGKISSYAKSVMSRAEELKEEKGA